MAIAQILMNYLENTEQLTFFWGGGPQPLAIVWPGNQLGGWANGRAGNACCNRRQIHPNNLWLFFSRPHCRFIIIHNRLGDVRGYSFYCLTFSG